MYSRYVTVNILYYSEDRLTCAQLLEMFCLQTLQPCSMGHGRILGAQERDQLLKLILTTMNIVVII